LRSMAAYSAEVTYHIAIGLGVYGGKLAVVRG
jgi:hypothetical protein